MIDSLTDKLLSSEKKNDSETTIRFSDIREVDAKSLIKMCSYNLEDKERMIWNDVNEVSDLIQCSAENVPRDRKQWIKHIHPDDQPSYINQIRQLTWDGSRTSIKFRVKLSNDRWAWLEETMHRLSGNEDTATHIKSVLLDITRFQDETESAIWANRHEGLTGLPNISVFKEKIETLTALALRTGSKGSIFRLRLTNLDHINSLYGFDIGDRMVCQISERLSKIIKVPDCLAKNDQTDETHDFLLGVMGLAGSDKDPSVLAGRLKQALCKMPYLTPQGPIKIDLEIGYTTFPQPHRDVDTLLLQTERALSFSADKSINGYSPIMGLPKNTSIMPLTTGHIEAALQENRISLAYQPIIYAKDGSLHHYECLLRLRQEDGHLVSAGRLIMAAEALGLVHLLDRRALEIATIQLKANADIKLALNVSAETVKSSVNAEDYINALKLLGEDASRVTLELTETAALRDPSLAAEFSNKIRVLGCEFSIDDFGSGHTSFSNLMAIEAETVKIDGSLIRGISTTKHMQVFVRMMVDLAQTFSVKTVAEMVEDRADAVLLRRLGVDYLQGYLFGMPSPTPNFSHQEL